MSGKLSTPYLDRVTVPSDLRDFTPAELKELADELRAEVIDVSR